RRSTLTYSAFTLSHTSPLSLHYSGHPRDLHSFPTRRSSDLKKNGLSLLTKKTKSCALLSSDDPTRASPLFSTASQAQSARSSIADLGQRATPSTPSSLSKGRSVSWWIPRGSAARAEWNKGWRPTLFFAPSGQLGEQTSSCS